MNGIASQHSQAQSLLNTSTISGPAGIADHNSGAGSTSISNQQVLQHSPHQNSTSPDDTNITSDNSPLSNLEPSTTTAAGKEGALAPKEQLPENKEGEVQSQIQPVVIKEEGEVLLGTVNGQIELLEHSPEANVGSGEAEVMVNEDAQDWIPDADHELKRVKVCQSSYPCHFYCCFHGMMPYSLCSIVKTASYPIPQYLPITYHPSFQVYELIGSRWMDQGTAFCFGQFQEETNEALLIARSERNYHDIVLSTAIRSNDVYQRQQGE